MFWVSYNIPPCPMPSRLRSWDNAGIEEVSGKFKLHTAQKDSVESSTSISSAGFVRNIVPHECLIKLLVHTGAQEHDDFIQQQVKEEAGYTVRLRKRFNRNE